jgi:nitrate reductase NapE component
MVVPPIIAFVDRSRARFLVVIIFLFPIIGYLGAPSLGFCRWSKRESCFRETQFPVMHVFEIFVEK